MPTQDNPPSEIPAELPLLPIRDIVVFPYMVLPLFVGRDVSIKAIEAALEQNRMIFLTTQKSHDTDLPAPEDLHTIGTAGIIMRMLKLPDERTKILVQGIAKARIVGIPANRPVLFGSHRKIRRPQAVCPIARE